jgi:hypothetical protein
MRYLIKLRLLPDENTLEFVRQLPEIRDLEIDMDYGLVTLSPKRGLYVIRVRGEIDPDKLIDRQPKVEGVYGDIKVDPIKQ